MGPYLLTLIATNWGSSVNDKGYTITWITQILKHNAYKHTYQAQIWKKLSIFH